MVTKLETYAPEGARSLRRARGATVYTDPGAARGVWEALYAQAPASPYQSFAFVDAWLQTLGHTQNATPFIVVAQDGDARALLPLVIERLGPLRVASFACGRESNFNLALIGAGATPGEADMRALLRDAAKASDARVDLFYLRNQPRRFEGADNPLAFANALPSPSFAYGAALPADAGDLDARFSKDARKKLRKKEARLAQMGELFYEHAASGDAAREIVAALLAQKAARLAAQGVGSNFGDASMHEFMERLLATAPPGEVEAHALRLSGRIVAAYVGLTRNLRFCAMVNSYDADDDIARSSPGELLLHALLRNLCARGFTHFDLGAGEARYKNSVCDETIELCDTLVPVTPGGALACAALTAAQRAKRKIKQTPWLFNALIRVRRRLAGVARD